MKLNKFFVTCLFLLSFFSVYAQESNSKSFAIVTINDGDLNINITNRDEKGYVVTIDSTFKLSDFKLNEKVIESYLTKAKDLYTVCKLGYNVPSLNTNVLVNPNIIKKYRKQKKIGAFDAFKNKLYDDLNTSVLSTSDEYLSAVYLWGKLPNETALYNLNKETEKNTHQNFFDDYFKTVSSLLDNTKIINGSDFVSKLESNLSNIFKPNIDIAYFNNMGYVNNNNLNIGGGLTLSLMAFMYPEILNNDTINIQLKDLELLINNLKDIDVTNFENFKGSINLLSIDKRHRQHAVQTQHLVKKIYSYNQFLSGAVLLKKLLLIAKADKKNLVFTNNAMEEQLFSKAITKTKLNTDHYFITQK